MYKTDPLNSSEGPFGGPRTSLWKQLLQKAGEKNKNKTCTVCAQVRWLPIFTGEQI